MTIEEIRDYLTAAIAEHGLPAVLQATARVMANIGRVTSGVVFEVAAIEAWLATRDVHERLAQVSEAEAELSLTAEEGP
jgi:hypothetical protein